MLVTVAARGSRIEVSLPSHVRVEEIVPALVGRCWSQPQPWSRWALGPSDGPPFPPRRTLAELGVVDWAELQLRDVVASFGVIGGMPDTRPAGIAAETDQRRRRISELTERLIEDIARIRAGRNPLLAYAAPEARRPLRALAPGPLDRAPQGGYADLSLAVSWPRDPRAPVEALATCRETAAGAGFPPDLRRSRRGPVPVATTSRRMSVRMTVDPDCQYLLEVSVGATTAR